MTQLQRLVLDYRSGELVARVLYRSEDLEALEGRVDVVGTSGYEVREDFVLCTAKSVAQLDEHKGMKRGA
jgi:hypothetical protein